MVVEEERELWVVAWGFSACCISCLSAGSCFYVAVSERGVRVPSIALRRGLFGCSVRQDGALQLVR